MAYHQYQSTTTIGWGIHQTPRLPTCHWWCHDIRPKQSRARLTCQEISTAMCRENITLNWSKWIFAQITVDFAGFILSPKGYQIDLSITQAITEFPTPANRTDLRSFIGLMNQLSANTPTMATLLAPLQPLLSTKNEYTWTKEFEAAFTNVKKSLMSAPILSYFDQDKETCLCTYTSRQGFGFVLQQKTGNTWSLIQAGSRFLSDPESRYAIIELELLAVAWAITKCDVFLAGLPHFTVVTDHHLLIPILNNHRLESHHKHRGTTPHNQTSQSCQQRSGIPETQILHHIRISPDTNNSYPQLSLEDDLILYGCRLLIPVQMRKLSNE